MRQIFKTTIFFAAFSLFLFAISFPASVAEAVLIENPLSAESMDQLLDAIVNFIFWVGMTIAPIIFIIAGFLYVTSAGDAKKVETAQHMIWYAVIGLAVLLLAKGFVAVLKSIIGVE